MSKGQPQGQVFHGILYGRSFYGIMFVIEGDLRDQKVNLKVKCLNNYIFVQMSTNIMCNTSL